ncbi:MAG: hypothetical protein ACRDUY_09175 [Nitriliruptorales bacterium]
MGVTAVIALAAAGVAVVILVALFLRRGRVRPANATQVLGDGSAPSQGSSRVRVLAGDRAADDARVRALREEIEGLRREAGYASQRGLGRRSERLQELIAERRRELESREGAIPTQ